MDLNIVWPEGQFLPTESEEIGFVKFINLMWGGQECLKSTEYRSLFLSKDKQEPLWGGFIYHFQSYVLLVASLYTTSKSAYKYQVLNDFKPAMFVPANVGHDAGRLLRFYRLGCKHEKVVKTTVSHGMHAISCERCSYQHTWFSV